MGAEITPVHDRELQLAVVLELSSQSTRGHHLHAYPGNSKSGRGIVKNPYATTTKYMTAKKLNW